MMCFNLWRDGGWAGVKRQTMLGRNDRWADRPVVLSLCCLTPDLTNVEADIHVVEGDPHRVCTRV